MTWIFTNVGMDDPGQLAVDLLFGDMVYMMSALLDPSLCLFWLEQDVLTPDEVKSEVKEMIIGRYKYTLFPNTLLSHYASLRSIKSYLGLLIIDSVT